ncbi:hypothetical protein ACLB2K_069029 [Fragaria x ananassa]
MKIGQLGYLVALKILRVAGLDFFAHVCCLGVTLKQYEKKFPGIMPVFAMPCVLKEELLLQQQVHSFMVLILRRQFSSETLLFAWWMCAIYTGLFRQSLQKKYHLKDSPCDPCMVHCCLHWCALCQEHREMKGHLSDNTTSMAMTVVNPPPVQEMNSSEKKDDAAAPSAESSGEENTNKELALQPM